MKFLLTVAFFLNAILTLSSQVELESLAKSEMANYHKLRDFSNKRTSGGNIDIVYAALHLTPNMKTAHLTGDVNYFFKTTGPVTELLFDLRTELTIDSIIYSGKNASFIHSSTQILTVFLDPNIPANALDSVRIYYKGTPDQSNRGYSRNVTASGPIIATLSEPYGAHYWWPCRENLSDKIDSLDVRVSVDTMYKVASNGLLQSITVFDDTMHTYHWKHRYPIATYLVAFSASRYATYSDYALLKNGSNLEILNYVFPHNETDSRIKTKATIPVIQFYDSLFGTYPFYKEKYGHAQFTTGGGMEHQTMSFMGNFGYDLIAHELAHQWFGDKITCGSWHDLWLNESFATYCNLLCYDFLKTKTEWLNQLKNFKKDIMSEDGGSVYAKDTVNNNALFSYRTTYQKGAIVLNQLRWVIGNEAFFTGVRNYINSAPLSYKFALGNNFQSYMEASSGMDLTDYFNDWITGEGYPTYTINWQQTGTEVAIDIIQTQSHPSVNLYNVPLPIFLKGDGRDTIITIPVSKATENYKINLPFKVKELVFDPDEWILGKNIIHFALNTSEDLFNIYPNPSDHNLYVSLNKTDLSGWQVYDACGKTVLTKTYDQSIVKGSIENIDLTSLASGIYTLVLQTTDSHYANKIILN